MPQISERGKLMPESPIRKLVPYSELAVKRGRKVYHLNIGQPDIYTPAGALKKVRVSQKKVMEYTHSAGYESYRKKLTTYYKKLGIDIDYTNILITTGASEAILFAFLACLNQNDEIIVPEPYYANYNGFAVSADIIIKPVASTIDNGFALPPVENIRRMITPKTKAIFICNPNNPTGYLYTKQELEQLKQIVIEHDLYLFADEVYREFCYDDATHFSVLNFEDAAANVVMIDSVSKRYSACGVRIGALISRNPKITDAILKFAQARLSPPGFGQIFGEAAVDTPDLYFEEVYAEYVERRNYIIRALNEIDGVYAPMPKGAFYTVIKLPVEDANHFCRWLLEEFEYQNQTVMLAPASGFYSSEGLGKDEARIAYVLNKEDLKCAVKCLKEALKVYPGHINN